MPLIEPKIAAITETVRIPTRRWTREEIDGDRDEAQQRLQNQDMAGWKKSIVETCAGVNAVLKPR